MYISSHFQNLQAGVTFGLKFLGMVTFLAHIVSEFVSRDGHRICSFWDAGLTCSHIILSCAISILHICMKYSKYTPLINHVPAQVSVL